MSEISPESSSFHIEDVDSEVADVLMDCILCLGAGDSVLDPTHEHSFGAELRKETDEQFHGLGYGDD